MPKNLTKITDIEKIKSLKNALKAAQSHLEYCGYGDKWERECAESSNLSGIIGEALEL